MPDNTLVFPPGFRLLDADGNVVSGGSVEFYNAGTSNARTVYSDSGLTSSLGSVVYLDSGGYPVSASGGTNKVSVYTGASAYKVIIKTSAAVTLATIDNIAGALDTSSFAVTSAAPERPVVSRASSSWTVDSSATDSGKIYKSNPTSGSQTVTLPSAITVGDGFTFTLIHDGSGSTNTVTWQTVSSQTVSINGQASRTAGALVAYGEGVTFISDGANWVVTEYKPGLISHRTPIFNVADRLTAPPSSPTPGARYIINGTPTGAWSSYAQHDVVEATGAGTWVKHTPPADAGWIAYIADENTYTAFIGSAWANLSGIQAAQSSTLRQLIAQHTETAGAAGGSLTASAWTKRKLNTTVSNTITTANGATGDASHDTTAFQITLPTGTYDVNFSGSFQASTLTAMRFISTTDSNKFVRGPQHEIAGSSGTVVGGRGRITVSGLTETFELQYYATNNTGGIALGDFLNTGTEIYAELIITDLASLQGPQGEQGPQGPTTGLDYAFDSATADADPGSGEFRLNNATLGSVTNIYISKTGRNSEDLGTYIGTWDDTGTSTNRATLLLKNINSATAFLLCTVNAGLTDATTYWKVPVTIRASGGTFTAGDIVSVLATPTGDTGSLGGTLGATANIVPRTSGTGGTTLQASGISAGTTGNDISHSGRTVRPWATLTCTNGTNNDVATPEGTNLKVSGPASTYTITGLTNGADGREIRVYNPFGSAMTIANESASSTAANRITTNTGADIATTAQGVVTMVYDAAASRWIVTGVQA